MKPKGIFAGLSTIDIIYSVSEHPTPNKKITAQSQHIIVGGPAANAAITFSFLGGETALVTLAGKHTLADVIREECRRFGIEMIDLTPDSLEAPPISSVSVDAKGQRSVISTNANGRSIPAATVSPDRLAGASVVMVDGHAMQACQSWGAAARSAAVTVVLDGGSWKSGTEKLLKNVDMAICSADFLPPGCSDEREVIEYVLAAGVNEVAITHGPAPIDYVSRSGAGVIEVPVVESVDTAGAGDIFHGAFCFYQASGCEFEQALRKAASIASDSCRYRGTRRWMESHRSPGSE